MSPPLQAGCVLCSSPQSPFFPCCHLPFFFLKLSFFVCPFIATCFTGWKIFLCSYAYIKSDKVKAWRTKKNTLCLKKNWKGTKIVLFEKRRAISYCLTSTHPASLSLLFSSSALTAFKFSFWYRQLTLLEKWMECSSLSITLRISMYF